MPVVALPPCVVEGRPLTAVLKGFAPQRAVTLRGPGIAADGVTDDLGTVRLVVTAPPRSGDDLQPDPLELVAAQRDAPAVAARGLLPLANLAVVAGAGTGSTTERRTWEFSGFPEGLPIVGHLRLLGRTRADHRFGVAEGPCGRLTTRARILPGVRATGGVWELQFDRRGTYFPATSPRVRARVTVLPSSRAPAA